MEKIIGIRDYESLEGSSNVAGFEVKQTNKALIPISKMIGRVVKSGAISGAMKTLWNLLAQISPALV